MLLRSLGRTSGWEEFTGRHLKDLRTLGVDENAIRERLVAEGALRPDATGRMFVLAEKLEAHARTLLGLPAVEDGYFRTKHILEVLPRRREKSFDEVLVEACSSGVARRKLEAAKAEERERNAERQRQIARSVRAVAFAKAFAEHPDAVVEIRQALDAFLRHFTSSEVNAIERFPELVRANADAFGTYFPAWRQGRRDMVPPKQLPSRGELLEAKLLGRRSW
jgi:hypothetical protein